MMRRTLALALSAMTVTAALAGCLGDEEVSQTEDPTAGLPDAPAEPRLAFAAPVTLNPDGLYGYEPSVHVGPNGTIFATAHKDSIVHEGDRLASWLWYSADDGESFSPMPSPAQAHETLPGLEGDFATDAAGHVYFMDTYGADNTLSRWDVSGDEPAWEISRPVHGTVGVDDRPWMAAHGDGVVYYASNNGAPLPAENDLMQPGNASRYWVYKSTDHGTTWSTGHGFAASGWCTIATDPRDDQTVYVGCDRSIDAIVPGLGPSQTVTVYESTDQADTFTPHRVAEFEHGLTDGYPNMAVDQAGTPYIAWPDGDYEDDSTTTVNVAHQAGNGSWLTHEITPHTGSFDEVWASGGQPGTLAVTFYGTNDTQPGSDTEWFAYAAVSTDADTADPSWTVTRLQADPVSTGPGSPDDFFMNDIGPDNAVHVTYEETAEDASSQDPEHPTRSPEPSNLLYTQQTIGPNLGNGTSSQLGGS